MIKSRVALLCVVLVLFNSPNNRANPHPAQATDFGVGLGGIAPHNAVIIYQGRQYVVDANQLFAKLQMQMQKPPTNGGQMQIPNLQLPSNGGQFIAPSNGKMPSFRPGNGQFMAPSNGKMPSFRPGNGQFMAPSNGKMPSFRPGSGQLPNSGQFIAPSNGKMTSFQPNPPVGPTKPIEQHPVQGQKCPSVAAGSNGPTHRWQSGKGQFHSPLPSRPVWPPAGTYMKPKTWPFQHQMTPPQHSRIYPNQ